MKTHKEELLWKAPHSVLPPPRLREISARGGGDVCRNRLQVLLQRGIRDKGLIDGVVNKTSGEVCQPLLEVSRIKRWKQGDSLGREGGRKSQKVDGLCRGVSLNDKSEPALLQRGFVFLRSSNNGELRLQQSDCLDNESQRNQTPDAHHGSRCTV